MPGRYTGPTYQKFRTPEARETRAFLRKKLGQLYQILGGQGKQYGVLRGAHSNGARWWVRIIPNVAGGNPLTQIFSELLVPVGIDDEAFDVRGFLAREFTGDLLSDAPVLADPEFAVHTERTAQNTGIFTCARSDYLKRKEEVVEDGGVVDWLSYNCQLMLTFAGYRDRYSIRDPTRGVLLSVFTTQLFCGGVLVEPSPPVPVIGVSVQQTTNSFYLHVATASDDLFSAQIWSVEVAVAGNRITVVGEWALNAGVSFTYQLRSIMLFDGAGAFACATLFSGDLLEVRFTSDGLASFKLNDEFVPEYPANCTRVETYNYTPPVTEQLLNYMDVPCVRPTGYCEETALTQTGTNQVTPTNKHTIGWSNLEEYKTPLSVDFDYKGRRVVGFLSMTPATSIADSGEWMTLNTHGSTNYSYCCLSEDELIDCIETYLDPPNTGWCWWVTDEIWMDTIYEGWKREVVSFSMDPFDFTLTAARETEGERDTRISEVGYNRYERITAAWDAKKNSDYSPEITFKDVILRDAEAGNVAFEASVVYTSRYAVPVAQDGPCGACQTSGDQRKVTEVIFDGGGMGSIAGKIREIDTSRTAVLYYDLRYGYLVRLIGKKTPTFTFTFTPEPSSNFSCGVYCQSSVQYEYTQILEMRCRDSVRSIEYTGAQGTTTPFVSRMLAACIDASQINQVTQQDFFMHPFTDVAWIVAPGVFIQEDFYFTRATDAQGNLLMTVPKEEKLTLNQYEAPILSFVKEFETLFYYHNSWLEKASIVKPDVGLWGIRSY